MTPEEQAALEAFRNEPKESWGEKDFSLYDVDGTVLYTAGAESDSGIGLFMPPSSYDDQEFYFRAATYRGIVMGMSAVDALEMMQLPPQAVFVDSFQLVETAEPFSLEKMLESDLRYMRIALYFDENFIPLNVLKVFPLTEQVHAVWDVQISIQDGVICEYLIGSMHYVHYGPGQR